MQIMHVCHCRRQMVAIRCDHTSISVPLYFLSLHLLQITNDRQIKSGLRQEIIEPLTFLKKCTALLSRIALSHNVFLRMAHY